MYLLSFTLDGDDYITIKYIQKSDLEGYVRLESHNPHHSPKEIPVDSIRALALVKASVRFNTWGKYPTRTLSQYISRGIKFVCLNYSDNYIRIVRENARNSKSLRGGVSTYFVHFRGGVFPSLSPILSALFFTFLYTFRFFLRFFMAVNLADQLAALF